MIALLSAVATAQPVVSVQAGFPWWQVEGALPLTERIAVTATWRTARFARHLPSVGALAVVVDRRWRLTGQSQLGWMLQTGTLASSGPAATALLRLERPGTVTPVLGLGARGLLLMERITTEAYTGTTTEIATTPALSVPILAGVGWQVRESMRLDGGLTFDQIEVPGISIPGAYAALTVGAWP